MNLSFNEGQVLYNIIGRSKTYSNTNINHSSIKLNLNYYEQQTLKISKQPNRTTQSSKRHRHPTNRNHQYATLQNLHHDTLMTPPWPLLPRWRPSRRSLLPRPWQVLRLAVHANAGFWTATSIKAANVIVMLGKLWLKTSSFNGDFAILALCKECVLWRSVCGFVAELISRDVMGKSMVLEVIALGRVGCFLWRWLKDG